MSDKKCLFFVIALIINTSILPARNVIDMSDRSFDCAAWTRKAFARGGVPPFSFVCDGVPSSEFGSHEESGGEED